MNLHVSDRFRDAGLLVLRVGIGLSFVGYGAPKLLGGPPVWEDLGQAMKYLGIRFAPAAWGFLAAVSELFGGMALVAGWLVRPAAFFLVCTMCVATAQHIGRGDGYSGGAFHSIEMGVVGLSLLLMGAGRYSLDEWLPRRRGTGVPRESSQ
jgi:putative oxidoreductase